MPVEESTETELSPQRVAELAANGGQLIDVREADEWNAGRIAGARHVELVRVPEEAPTIDRDAPVVFYCRSGNRSAMAAAALREAGYDAYNMAGGILAWAEADLPLEPDDGRVAERSLH